MKELRLKELKNKLINMCKGLSFEELETLLNKNSDPDVRHTIIDAMEKYHEEKFNNWLENC